MTDPRPPYTYTHTMETAMHTSPTHDDLANMTPAERLAEFDRDRGERIAAAHFTPETRPNYANAFGRLEYEANLAAGAIVNNAAAMLELLRTGDMALAVDRLNMMTATAEHLSTAATRCRDASRGQ